MLDARFQKRLCNIIGLEKRKLRLYRKLGRNLATSIARKDNDLLTVASVARRQCLRAENLFKDTVEENWLACVDYLVDIFRLEYRFLHNLRSLSKEEIPFARKILKESLRAQRVMLKCFRIEDRAIPLKWAAFTCPTRENRAIRLKRAAFVCLTKILSIMNRYNALPRPSIQPSLAEALAKYAVGSILPSTLAEDQTRS